VFAVGWERERVPTKIKTFNDVTKERFNTTRELLDYMKQ
jgi:hypothetical protein